MPSRILRWLAMAAAIAFAESAAPSPAAAQPPIYETVYTELDAVRDARRQDLVDYLGRIRALAESVPADETMRRYFLVKSDYHRLLRRERPPAEAVAAIEELKASIRRYYFEHFNAFYDILFVDASGFVFSTIRQESDYHQDLFAGGQGRSALVDRLQQRPGEAFVDYEYYTASDEPSAFFVQPMIEGGQQRGWFVMQLAINKINSLFGREAGLGATGEVFLVNRQHQMLTESRFRPEHSVLRLHLSRQNIESKFAERVGHKMVVDYRGFTALTSFEVVPIMGTEWLLIAKIDEDEVLTRMFREDRARIEPLLLAAAARQSPPSAAPPARGDAPMVVDLDEFRRSEEDRPLMTYGVNTCTAVVVRLPHRFAYLGHASVYDRMYGRNEMDLMGNLLTRVRMFEIRPYERRGVDVTVIAPHRASIGGLLDILLDEGFLLSQIRFVHDPSARSGSVLHDPLDGITRVGWSVADERVPEDWRRADTAPSLGELLKSLPDGSQERR
jgi:hypothetical protein